MIPESATRLERQVDQRLPRVELSDLLIEVDGWSGFTTRLEHLGYEEALRRDLLRPLYGSLLAQACNIGPTKMAQITDWNLNPQRVRERSGWVRG